MTGTFVYQNNYDRADLSAQLVNLELESHDPD